MAEIRVTPSKYNDVLNELNIIKGTLEESINEIDGAKGQLEELQSGRSIDYHVTKLQDTKTNLDNYTAGEVANMIEVTNSLILLIKDNLKPKNENSVVVIDTEKVKASLNKSLNLFSSNSSELKSIAEDSDTFDAAIKGIHNELDDDFGEAILNPIDEIKQRKAEKVFRANEVVMDNINVYLSEELTFKNELDAIEDLINEFDNFDNVFDPMLESLGNISLYDSFMDNKMGVAHASSSIEKITPDEKEPIITVDQIHKILDIVGLWPGIIGMVSDAINAGIYLVEFLFYGKNTWDDIIYSLAGFIPGGKAGIKAALEEAKKIGFNPIKLIANSDFGPVEVGEKIVNLLTIAMSAITNGADDWNIGMGFTKNIESLISMMCCGLKGA